MKKWILSSVFTASTLLASATVDLHYGGEALVATGTGDFAPYYTSVLRHGRLTQSTTLLGEVSAWVPMHLDRRFSWGACVDLVADYGSSVEYARYNPNGWSTHKEHPAPFWIQQAFAEIKYRGVFLTVGAKEHGSALLNQQLSSGDLVESGNARPIPEARAGFVDFQNIPFTNGWVQIQGEIGWGKMTDSDWWADRYNRYNYHIVSGEWYNYKRCYFRTKPTQPLSVTVGMQAAVTFGGTVETWREGVRIRSRKHDVNFKSFLNSWLPMPGGEEFYEGNHLGSWDFVARYRFASGQQLRAYFQWPWEDGSGIGRRNGWDGLWGIEWTRPDRSWITGAVIELLEFTNQSGPQHFAPGDLPGGTITSESTGADDYYNNAMYNSYAYYGLSIGTPAIMAPLYNRDGYPAYIGNRLRGFHAAATGFITDGLSWRLRAGYRKAWGNGMLALPKPVHLTSVSLDVDWQLPRIKGLSVNGAIAIDRGTMPCNAFGITVGVKYNGLLKL